MSAKDVLRAEAKLIVDLYMMWQDGEAVIDWRKVSKLNKYGFARLMLQIDGFPFDEIFCENPINNMNILLNSALRSPDIDNRIELADAFMDRCVDFYDDRMQEWVAEILEELTNQHSIPVKCPQTGETTWR